MRTLTAALVLLAAAPAAAKPRAVLLFSSGPDEHGQAIYTPIACPGPHGALTGGADCLTRAARGPISLGGTGTTRVRATRLEPPCTSGQDDGTPALTIPAFIVDRGNDHLAVWPATANVGLREADAIRSLAPTAADARAFAPETVTQVFVDDLDGDGLAERVYVVVDRRHGLPVMHADLVITDGTRHPLARLHADFLAAVDAEVLGSSDVDGDGKRELIVRYPAVNDFGLAVWEYGTPAPIYQFDCGNV
jgi:hypothetical protein